MAQELYLSLLTYSLWYYKVDMKEIYKNCPEGFEVDHILPLNNPILCGLHTPWNLQYLTPDQNKTKSNKIMLGDL